MMGRMMQDRPYALWRGSLGVLTLALVGTVNEHVLWERFAVTLLAAAAGVGFGMAIIYAATEDDG